MDCLTWERVCTIREGTYALKLMISSVRSHPLSNPATRLLATADVRCHEAIKHEVVILCHSLGCRFFQYNAALHVWMFLAGFAGR